MTRKIYPSDLSDVEWQLLEPLIPAEKPGGKKRTVNPGFLTTIKPLLNVRNNYYHLIKETIQSHLKTAAF